MIVCYWHPERPSNLKCGICDKPMCVLCLRHHPVGIRCKICSETARLPTYQLSTYYYFRGLCGALVLGLFGGLVTVGFDSIFAVGFLRLFFMMALGYFIGEGLSISVNRKRSRELQAIAGAGVIISLVTAFLMGDPIGFTNLFTLFGIGIAIVVAVNRVRP